MSFQIKKNFSTKNITYTKSKERNSRNTETLDATLRASLSRIKPQFDVIISSKQAQVLHKNKLYVLCFL